MERKTAGLLGLLAGVAGMGVAHAGPAAAAADAMRVASYADLLKPIPDAVNALRLSDARLRAGAPVERVQYFNGPGPGAPHHHHHHHHHHHAPPPPVYHHHHHHHHHQGATIVIPVPGIGVRVN